MCAENATGARLVLRNHRLTGDLRQPLSDGAADIVDDATGAVRENEPDRSTWIVLCLSSACNKDRGHAKRGAHRDREERHRSSSLFARAYAAAFKCHRGADRTKNGHTVNF